MLPTGTRRPLPPGQETAVEELDGALAADDEAEAAGVAGTELADTEGAGPESLRTPQTP